MANNRPTRNNARRGGTPQTASNRPKGQVRSGKTVQYSIKDKQGDTKYVGTTNNPTRRAAEHRASGKLQPSEKLVVETRAIDRQKAEKVEAAKLASHRRQKGANPARNRTNDGKYHPGRGS